MFTARRSRRGSSCVKFTHYLVVLRKTTRRRRPTPSSPTSPTTTNATRSSESATATDSTRRQRTHFAHGIGPVHLHHLRPNSDTNLDPTDAVVVGVCEVGLVHLERRNALRLRHPDHSGQRHLLRMTWNYSSSKNTSREATPNDPPIRVRELWRRQPLPPVPH